MFKPTQRRIFKIASIAALFGLATPVAILADADAGSYLAARHAGAANDYENAVTYFQQSLTGDPTNPGLLESAMVAHVGLGDFGSAMPYAAQMSELGMKSQISSIVTLVAQTQAEDWAAIQSGFEAGQTIGPLVDGLAQAWAFVGQGKMTDAIESFDAVTEIAGLRSYGLYHKALALASVGDFEGADAILALSPQDGLQPMRRAILARVEVLSQLGRNTEAITLIDRAFGPDPDPTVAGLRFRLEAGEPLPFSFLPDASSGMGEVFLTVAQALSEEADSSYIILYARAAQALAPTNTEATIVAAQHLEQLQRYDLANQAYALIDRDNPAYLSAELGRAAVLRRAGKPDQAIEVLAALARDYPDQALVHASHGDVLRQTGDMAGASAAYDLAVDLYADTDPTKWFVVYTRAITQERLGNWPQAEADFRAALVLSPGQSSVLNYLGYSLVERNEKLDEALAMIEQAAKAEPENGAIIDSLGWVLYRVGRYQEAAGHLERAAQLEPVDPVVNDHLGDALWAVGRETEARFQWQRALSFDPEEADADRMRRKIATGLDAVLAEDGAAPLSVARDDR